ncbi:MAG: imidazole glycerol phosphate synthase subunit HisF [Rhodospirillales bacterium]
MTAPRIIARLDVKNSNVIKGIQLEGLRVVGGPNELAKRYYAGGIDEIIYMDAVASLYGRNNLAEIVERTANDVYVPITVGGGVRSVDDARRMFHSGADKVAVNTAAVHRPELISEIAETFGSQAVVLSIEAKRMAPGEWSVFTDNGREPAGLDVVQWAQKGARLGAGEILLTSVDKEGMAQGFDVALTNVVSTAVSIPVIASGGMGAVDDAVDVIKNGRADAVAAAHVLHYGVLTLNEIRAGLRAAGVDVRPAPEGVDVRPAPEGADVRPAPEAAA